MSKRIDSPVYFVTRYQLPGGKAGEYRTKTLTAYHESIRERSTSATTLLCDRSVAWPFGVFAEQIASK